MDQFVHNYLAYYGPWDHAQRLYDMAYECDILTERLAQLLNPNNNPSLVVRLLYFYDHLMMAANCRSSEDRAIMDNGLNEYGFRLF